MPALKTLALFSCLFVIMQTACLLMPSTSAAVEPTLVNFGARAQAESALVEQIDGLFEAHERKVRFVLEDLEGRDLSPAFQRELVRIYFKHFRPLNIEIMNLIETVLIEQATNGRMTEATLLLILEQSTRGRLLDVLHSAFIDYPVMRSKTLDDEIHRKFRDAVLGESSISDVPLRLLKLVDADTVAGSPKVIDKLAKMAEKKGQNGFRTVMGANPELAARIGSGFPVFKTVDLESIDNLQISHTYEVRNTPSTKKTAGVEATVRLKVRRAALQASRSHIRRLFSTPGEKVEYDAEMQIRNALDLFGSLESLESGLSAIEPFADALERLALMPHHDDTIRMEALKLIAVLSEKQPALRESYLQAALMIEVVPRTFVIALERFTRSHPLNERERALLLQFVNRPNLPSDETPRKFLAIIRRKLMQPVAGGSCGMIFAAKPSLE